MNNKQFRQKLTLLATAPMLFLMGGCATHLTSNQVSTLKGTLNGPVYDLPMIQYEVSIQRQIHSCTAGEDIDTKVNIEVKEDFIPDPGATFVLDYRDMTNGASTSEFMVEYYENSTTLKSINLESKDESAAVAVNVFNAVANVALAAVGVPAVTPTPQAAVPSTDTDTKEIDKEEKQATCNAKTVDALEQLELSKGRLVDLTNRITNQTEEVERLNLLLTSVEKPSEELMVKQQNAIKELEKKKKELVNHKKSRAPYLARTQHVDAFRWPDPTQAKFDQKVFLPGAKLLNQWFNCAEIITYKNNTSKSKPVKCTSDFVPALSVSLNVLELLPSSDDNIADTGKGVFYRHPVPVDIKICTEAPCDQGGKSQKTIRSMSPQHGRIVLLPFENEALENNRLEVAFNPSGAPSKVSYKSLQSGAKVASQALASSAELLPGVRQQILNADLDKLKRETALFEQKKALEDAKKAMEDSQTADIEAETSLVNANTALINANIANIEAQARLNELEE